MYFNGGVRHIGEVSLRDLQPVVYHVGRIDWKEFPRTEIALRGGFSIPVTQMFVPVLSLYTSFHSPVSNLIAAVLHIASKKYGPVCVIYGELSALDPGVSVQPHRDACWWHPITHRLHVPILPNRDAFLGVEGYEPSTPLVLGDVAELNNRSIHWASNYGKELRVHLILDVWPRDPELRKRPAEDVWELKPTNPAMAVMPDIARKMLEATDSEISDVTQDEMLQVLQK